MIGLDTNLLVRHLAQDDPDQSHEAVNLIEHALTEETPGFIGIVVMVETVWVLQRAYGFDASEIAAAIERVLQADVLLVEYEQEVFTAMLTLKEDQTSFADALIGALNKRSGCSATVTFDRRAARLVEFELL